MTACAPRKPAAITGIVTYSSVKELSDNAQMQLFLNDVSADGSAPEIATATVDIKQLPSQYSLPYDPAKIDASHRYTISARIYIGGALKYATDSAVEVLAQGKGNQVNFSVVATGASEAISSPPQTAQAAPEVFQGTIRNGADISLYRAGITDGHVNWIEEDRSNGTPTPAHNSYTFKGALLIHYKDTGPLEITFDDAGKPKSVVRDGKTIEASKEMPAINAARNRASLLRADALQKRESQMHRNATKNDVTG